MEQAENKGNPMAERFKVLKEFSIPAIGHTVYCAGMTYTIDESNEKLSKLATCWADAGLITFIADNSAKVSGG